MKIAFFAHNRDYFGAKLIHIPLLWTIRKKYSPEITVYTPYKNNKIFLETGLVKEVIFYPFSISWLLKELKDKEFDIAISLRDQALWLNFVLFLSGIHKRIGFKNSFSFLANTESKLRDMRIYRAINFNNLIDNALALDSYFKNFSPAKLAGIKNIFILPGCGDKFKRWNIENFISVCEKLCKDGYYFYFVLGDDEKEYLEKINLFLQRCKGEVLYNFSLQKLISYFQEGDIFISNDCGPVHIAQMMFKKVVILYSDEFYRADRVIAEWFLLHKNSIYIKSAPGKSINTIEVDEVVTAAKKLLEL